MITAPRIKDDRLRPSLLNEVIDSRLSNFPGLCFFLFSGADARRSFGIDIDQVNVTIVDIVIS